MTVFSRRQALRLAGASAGLAGVAELRSVPVAAETSVQADPPAPCSRLPRMVQEWMVGQVRHAEQNGLRSKSALRNRADAETYVGLVRSRIHSCFGDFPERSPLNPKVTGVLERDRYRIENILFESRPGFLVTANLYVPKGHRFPRPGVVGSCGHSVNGKAAETYQAFCQGLARLGYVVLIFDPIGQGERLQYTDSELKPRRGVGVSEHLYCGNQQFLVGEFFGTWRAWDGVRALDYLLSREEVDPDHVGITGNSGGGTMTTWLCGLDSRWTMAAPSCFVTTFRRNLENELPADTEQCPPRALALALDHDDFLAAMAPKPVMILAQERDYFDVRGSTEAYGRLRRLYSLLGAEERVEFFVGPRHHGFSKENREAMYRFFNRVVGIDEDPSEDRIVVEPDELLQCTPRGQVADMGSRPIYLFTAERSRELRRARPDLHGDRLRQAVLETLKMPPIPDSLPDYRILRPAPAAGFPLPHAGVYLVETEPGIHAVVRRLDAEPLYSRPPAAGTGAILYVSHQAGEHELAHEPLVRRVFAEEGEVPVFACDLRGCGDSRPDVASRGWDGYVALYGSDYMLAAHSIMLDRPYPGQRTFDLLRVLAWLAGLGHTEIHTAASGWGTVPAACAALLSDNVVRVTLAGAPESFASIAESEDYDWPLSSLIPDVLRHWDLPDVYGELQDKQLRMVSRGRITSVPR